jgi:hypothetical protein
MKQGSGYFASDVLAAAQPARPPAVPHRKEWPEGTTLPRDGCESVERRGDSWGLAPPLCGRSSIVFPPDQTGPIWDCVSRGMAG